MPTVLRIGPYRFFFFSNEGNELPARELNEIERIIREHQAEFMEAWNEHLG